eukprot:767881-Hanusia_phi.AAC.2
MGLVREMRGGGGGGSTYEEMYRQNGIHQVVKYVMTNGGPPVAVSETINTDPGACKGARRIRFSHAQSRLPSDSSLGRDQQQRGRRCGHGALQAGELRGWGHGHDGIRRSTSSTGRQATRGTATCRLSR